MPLKAQVAEQAALPPLVLAVQQHVRALKESETRTAYYVSDSITHVIRVQTVGLNLRRKNLSESRLAIGHVAYGGDVQDTVVHEPSIGCIITEGVAVRFSYAAVGSQAEVHQAWLVDVPFVQMAQKQLNTHAFVVVGGSTQAAAVGVRPVHGSYYMVWRCRHTCRNHRYYTHNLKRFMVVVKPVQPLS